MELFDTLLERLALIRIVDVIDILLVTLIIFGVLMLIRGTRAVQLLRGLLVLGAIIFLLAQVFELRGFTWLIDNMLPVLLLAIPVIFQPELRRALEQLGLAGRYLRFFRQLQANRHIGRTGPAGAHQGNAGINAARGQNADAGWVAGRALPACAVAQTGGNLRGFAGELAVGQGLPTANHSGCVGGVQAVAINCVRKISVDFHAL